MPIDAIGAIASDIPRSASVVTDHAPKTDFAQMVGSGLAGVDQSLKAADGQLRALAAGQAIPLHDVMISMEQARLDLMLAVEVRNRVLEGYQELMRMQL